MRAFLDLVLDSYEKHGVDELASRTIADFLRIRHPGPRLSVSCGIPRWRGGEAQQARGNASGGCANFLRRQCDFLARNLRDG